MSGAQHERQEAKAKTRINGRLLRILFLCAFFYIFDQMDTNLFSYASPVLMTNWGVTVDDIAVANSVNFFGMFLGAVFGGWFADRVGRKKGIILSVTLFSIGSLAGGLAWNFPFLVFTRLIAGIGLISMVVVTMTYITEIAPSAHRGKVISLTMALGTLGVPVGSAIAAWIVPMSEESWRVIFIFGGLTILFLPLCFSWLKETPRWLFSKGRAEEARVIAEYLYDDDADRVSMISMAAPRQKTSSNRDTLKVMFSKDYLQSTIVVICITISVTLGVHLLTSFYTVVMQEYAGFELTVILTIMAVSWWGMPLGNLLAASFTDKGGRKIPLGVFQGINGLTYVVAGLFANPIVLGTTLFLSRLFGGGAVSILYTYQAENYPTRIRSTAVGLISGASRLLSSLGVYIVPPILAAGGWVGIHMFNAAIIIIPCIILFIWGKRTGGRSLEEINAAE